MDLHFLKSGPLFTKYYKGGISNRSYVSGIPTLALICPAVWATLSTCVGHDGRDLLEMPAMADAVHRQGLSSTEKKLTLEAVHRPGHFNVRKKLVIQAIGPSKGELTAILNSDSDGAPKFHSLVCII